MESKRELLLWGAAALGASALLAAVLLYERRTAPAVSNPRRGADLFFGKAGCAHCHAVNGRGGHSASDPALLGPHQTGLGPLVASLWNQGPEMRRRIDAEHLPHMRLDDREMAHLLAFLYAARYADPPGDATRGHAIFIEKQCAQCHGVRGEGGKSGPALVAASGRERFARHPGLRTRYGKRHRQ